MAKYVVIVFEKDRYVRCWRTEVQYKQFHWSHGFPHGCVHKASNFNGRECVRHLCGDNRCINPLHHREGSLSENQRDKGIKMRRTREIRWMIRDELKIDNEVIVEELADLIYADEVAYKLKRMGLNMLEGRKLAKYVWQNIVLKSPQLLVVNSYRLLIERSISWILEIEM